MRGQPPSSRKRARVRPPSSSSGGSHPDGDDVDASEDAGADAGIGVGAGEDADADARVAADEPGAAAPARVRHKRAATACHQCRSRKVKCSNDRPTCAGCARMGLGCVYPDDAAAKHAPMDQQMNRVLSALGEILERLPQGSSSSSGTTTTTTTTTAAPFLQATATSQYPAEQLEHVSSSSAYEPPAHHGRSTGTFDHQVPPDQGGRYRSLDYLFQWPIFPPLITTHYSPDHLLIMDQQESRGDEDGGSGRASDKSRLPQIDPEEVCRLVQIFLLNVHVRDPILDCKTLRQHAQTVAELGPQWDSKTCLVLISAALGAIPRSFDAVPDTPDSLQGTPRVAADKAGLLKAEAYYQAARRRFGLLDRSLTACHCYLLAGTYLMYMMRPVPAWQAYFEAATICSIYLRGQDIATKLTKLSDNGQDALSFQLEQRLYWSCIKSESDICSEVAMPTSSLSSVEYPVLFPAPPHVDDDIVSDQIKNGDPRRFFDGQMPMVNFDLSPPNSNDRYRALQEQSWLHYYSEISMLRISNQITNAFYAKEPSSWSRMNALDMVNITIDLEHQLVKWKDALPEAICCFETPPELGTIDELELATWSRHSLIRTRLYRPLLYKYAHLRNDGSQANATVRDLVRPFAEKALLASLEPLNKVGLKHRHAATWYRCRASAAHALTIICARKAGLVSAMRVDDEAAAMCDFYCAHLRYWKDECADLRQALEVIEAVLDDEFSS